MFLELTWGLWIVLVYILLSLKSCKGWFGSRYNENRGFAESWFLPGVIACYERGRGYRGNFEFVVKGRGFEESNRVGLVL